MKLLSQTFYIAMFFITSSVFACPVGQYGSTEGATLSLLSDLVVKVELIESEQIVYSGYIDGYLEYPENGMYEVIPDKSSSGKNATIHLGGTCQYIKMYWWSGERGKSNFYKYVFKRNT